MYKLLQQSCFCENSQQLKAIKKLSQKKLEIAHRYISICQKIINENSKKVTSKPRDQTVAEVRNELQKKSRISNGRELTS